jgi:hypothetical protein
VSRKSQLHTDESRLYTELGKEFASHEKVHHSRKEYVRDGYIHTNTVENVFSVFKRGMKGVISTVAKRICTATLPSSISAIIAARL